METFNRERSALFEQLGEYKKMVLSTSLHDRVTSRMMSVVITDHRFYFQTDKNFRKYEQMIRNCNASLCTENVQIEGTCTEIGHPSCNQPFCNLYKEYYKGSYDRYTFLENERLFVLQPTYIQKWIYIDEIPYIEIYDFERQRYEKKVYISE